jgi:lysophospholipase L1-like esterase
LINTSAFWEREVLDIEQRNESTKDVDIVFYGSSSIRLWQTVKEDFDRYHVLNHGFGGSKINDATYFYDRLVTTFNPKLVVCFSGSNDIQSEQKHIHKARRVFRIFKKLYKKHMESTGVPMIYITITPTPSRQKYMKQVLRANELIKRFSLKHDQLYVLDLTKHFLVDGMPNEKLFVNDGLHMNVDGYDIWQKALLPMIDDLLK